MCSNVAEKASFLEATQTTSVTSRQEVDQVPLVEGSTMESLSSCTISIASSEDSWSASRELTVLGFPSIMASSALT